MDNVHQADVDGIKGVYLINAVDEVTQFQAVFAVEHISEAYLLPVPAAMTDAFPFVIRNLHSDNGSEYINHKVAKLLEKLRIEETKSRSRKTNDNALAESKNAATVPFPSQLNAFTVEVLSPYLNYHRPCHFPTKYIDKKGKLRKRYQYQDMMMPDEKFRSLPAAESHLKPATTFAQLDAIATEFSDNEAAQHLNQARAKLFQSINKSQQSAT